MIRDARERQGIRLEKVSSDLHIRVTYLQAIENGRSEILPSPVQGRGFVRMFAHYLKLDPESVLAIWDSPLPNETPSTGSEDAPGSSPNAPKRPGAIWKKLRKKPDESQRPVPSAEPVSPAQSIYDQIGEQLREPPICLGRIPVECTIPPRPSPAPRIGFGTVAPTPRTRPLAPSKIGRASCRERV